MVKMYYDGDIDESKIKSKKVAILGCGSQGHAHALNLQDSGVEVCVGLREGSKTWKKAESAGLKVLETSQAATWGDVIVMLLPDTAQKDIYEKSVKSNLTTGKSLVFAHGFNIRFDRIVPPSDVDVWMVAPKGPGHRVRTTFVQDFGVPALFAVEQNASGDAQDLALGYAKMIGAGRAGILETTFTEETETDLFGEQAVLCGGCTALVKAGFETLVKAGYQPEVAYFECLHELKLIVDLMAEGGMAAMRYSISDTAEYGDYISGPRIIDASVKERMGEVLEDIKNGNFAKKFVSVMENGGEKLKAIREKEAKHQIEEVGERLRGMMRIDKKDSGDDNFNASADS
ncbi:ketol-acid reductoisomerase [Candidatus Gracilibacteria bacterium]|nr:ketol-acid reductoisomerase [Candidatus Gracilibacteria bacterium]